MQASIVLHILILILALCTQARAALPFQKDTPTASTILYATAMEFLDDSQELYLFTVDQGTGVCTNLTLLEVYSTDVTDMIDGVSAVDQKKGLYYYATDFLTPLLYVVELKNGQARAPIDLNGAGVNDIVINPSTSEVVITTVNSPPSILGFTFPEGPLRVIKDLRTTNYQVAFASDFDEVNDIFYLAATANRTSGEFDLLYMNPHNGDILRAQEIDGCGKSLLPMFMHYDSQTKMIYIGAVAKHENINWPLYWSLLTVDPVTGTCTAHSILEGADIITAWTYDRNSQNLLYALNFYETSYINIVTGIKGPILTLTCDPQSLGAYTGV